MTILGELELNKKIKYGRYKGKDLVWRIVDKYNKDYPSGSITLMLDEIACLKAFDGKEPSNSNSDRQDYGNNRYKYSNIRQWLNKQGKDWYEPQHSYDAPPNSSNVYRNPYDTEPGFLTEFTDEEINAIIDTPVKTAIPGFDGGGTETLIDKVFLPSRTEMGLNNEIGGKPEGTKFPVFNSNSDRVAQYNGSNDWYWLRTPGSGYANDVRDVSSDGSLHRDSAYYGNNGVRPALNLKSDNLVSDTTDADGAYTIIHNKPPLISDEDKNLGDKNAPFTYTYQVSDPDGDTVSITEKINNTTIRNLSNAPQKQNLTVDISEKWSELAIDTEHTITITATDDKGNKATRVIRFTKVNAPPVISGVDGFIGDKNMPFSYKYQVSDPDGDPIKVIERLNGIAINTRTNAPQGTDLTVDINKETLYTLPLNTMHTISIEASDDKGNTSYRNATFRRVNSAAIVESDAPNDFGEITDIPTISYQVSDPEGDAITVEELLDGEILRTVKNATPNQEMFVTIPQEKWLTIGLGQHTVKVRATDAFGAYSEKTFKFTKVEDRIIVESKPIETEVMLAKIVPVVNTIVPAGYNMKFEACNNAFDDSPAWEDVTSEALQMQAYSFTNMEKTADKWGFAMRISILPEVV